MKKVITCSTCNKDFETVFCTPRRIPKYCSRQCCFKGLERPKVAKRCETCHKDFLILEAHAFRRFCSQGCVRTVKKGDPHLGHSKGTGFWANATQEQKIEKYRQMFDDRVIRSNGCWGWKSFINSTGCGMLGVTGHMVSAYRCSWILYRGPIPEGKLVLHKCHNRVCSNPDHLYIGTNKDNTRDMIEAGRQDFCKQKSKLAKLNPEKVKEIKEMLRDGKSQHSIAKIYNVSRGTIQDIFRLKSWRNI